jgi:hypothetical protein
MPPVVASPHEAMCPDDREPNVKRPSIQGKKGLRPLITALIVLAAALCVAGFLTHLEPLVWVGAVAVLAAGILEMTYRL